MKKIIAAALAAASTLSLVACVGVASEAAVKRAATDAPTVTFAVVGDSISDPGSANNVPDTWVKQIAAGSDTSVRYVGGYNHFGYTCGQLADAVQPNPADVLVIECGTNDINHGVSTATTLADIDRIRAAVGAPHVLLVPTPPNDNTASAVGDRRALGATLNRQLIARAWGRGWLYADPFYSVRDTNNGYVAGYTVDGTHGTYQANTFEAQRFSTYIKQAAVGARP